MIKINILKCGYCGACVGVCKTMALELIENTIFIKKDLCTNCKNCIIICPLNAIEEE